MTKAQAAATFDVPGAVPRAAASASHEPAGPHEPVPADASGPTLEERNAALAAALKALDVKPTAPTERRVAEEYLRLGVLDHALDHFAAAAKLDTRDAAAHDGLARVWRDWGMPEQALPEAYRAVNLAPDWAQAQNTLGTVLFTLGEFKGATARFDRTLALDPGATYALNNLCYVSLAEGNAARAVEECQSALRQAPGMAAAANNLALVYAASGQMDRAAKAFAEATDASTGQYNLGIVHLARREYARAADAFATACAGRPSTDEACIQAREARRLAASPAAIKSRGGK